MLYQDAANFEVGPNSSPAPYVTMSRGQSSRTRTPDAGSAPTTPSRPRPQAGTPSTVKKRSQHFESPTKATDPRSPFSPSRHLDQQTARLGAASSLSGPSVSSRINLSAWKSGLDKNLFPDKPVAPTPTEILSSASGARPMPVWTVVVSDSETENEMYLNANRIRS
ncbi:hypothetical protein FA13DRAFT_251480 [Coprinellus micaceus]|uniref:Uncharacterized protein n=1 Tax=Coprinellus micaceus TaxID=71717 RepID=A0A4Y7TDZ4_COPMI|nr:hypothetical protein FA13DRAFT_251480 [Coprinellus micaceus]